MDQLDQLLLDAWNRISARLRVKRLSALKRSQRRFKGVLTRPMREWCLVIRASDTRINSASAIVEPVPPLHLGAGWGEGGALALTPAPSPGGRGGLIENHQPHMVTLSGSLIRRLTQPVSIRYPGVTIREAAALCGRDYKTMKIWVHRAAKKGAFRIDHYPEFGFPPDTARSKQAIRHDGVRMDSGGRPYVWTPSPIDLNNFEGRQPHAVWGTLWQGLWEELPEEYELVVRREPMQRMRHGRMCFRGWNFTCPGRLVPASALNAETRPTDARDLTVMNDERAFVLKPCGRRCTYLYAPQTVWTLAMALGVEEGFDMPEEPGPLRFAGQWIPGAGDPVRSAAGGRRSFACKECWNLRSACMANYNGWNEFIAQISGGLLYGRDVPRPKEVCPVRRKKRRYSWKRGGKIATSEPPATKSATGA